MQEIDEEQDIANYFYTLPTTYKSRSALVFPDDEVNPLKFVDLASFETGRALECASGESDAEAEVSIWLILDTESAQGAQTLRGASLFLVRGVSGVRSF